MKISDVIMILGNTPLSEFPWGCIVKTTINLFVDDEHRVTESSTGLDVHAALGTLPKETRDIVLSASIDADRCCAVTSIGGGMAIEHVDEETTSQEDLAALRQAVFAPQFIAFAVLVVVPLAMGALLLSNLSIHDGFSLREAILAFVKVFGIFT